MLKSQVLQLISQQRLVAILRLDDLSQAAHISRGLADGGIHVQEFTLTNPDALDAMNRVKAEFEHSNIAVAIGIGSVRNGEEAAAAIDAGADFIVSPITDSQVIEKCRAAQVAVMPGAYTPTEIDLAWRAGADIVKVFPARGLGPHFIKDVLAPMPTLKLMPTGGIDLKNMASYFEAGAVAVGCGGNLIDAAAIANHDWARLTSIAQAYTQVAQGRLHADRDSVDAARNSGKAAQDA